MSYWSSLEWVSCAHRCLQIAYISLAVLSAVTAVVSFVVNERKTELLQEKQDKDRKDDVLQIEKLQSELSESRRKESVLEEQSQALALKAEEANKKAEEATRRTASPILEIGPQTSQENQDGTVTVRALLTIIAPIPPKQLFLEVHAPDILSFEVIPQRNGAQIFGHSGKREGFAFTSLMQPFGSYIASVQMKKLGKIELVHRFE